MTEHDILVYKSDEDAAVLEFHRREFFKLKLGQPPTKSDFQEAIELQLMHYPGGRYRAVPGREVSGCNFGFLDFTVHTTATWS